MIAPHKLLTFQRLTCRVLLVALLLASMFCVVARFTHEVINGKMEVAVECDEGASYENKKIVLNFDYTTNTIKDKVFH